MLRFLQRVTCQHVWTWSERRQAERCYRCRATRKAAPPEAFVSGLAPPKPEPEPEPEPSKHLTFPAETEAGIMHFHAEGLYTRLVVDRPADVATPHLSTNP